MLKSSPSSRPSELSSRQRAELIRLSGTNPLLSSMLKRGEPLTRQAYINLNWQGNLPAEVDEDEQEVLDLLP